MSSPAARPGVPVFAFLCGLSSAIATAAPPTKYDFRPGQTATYRVEIEIDGGQVVHTFSGTPTYTVKEVKDGNATVRFAGTLAEGTKPKEGAGRVFPRPSFVSYGGLSDPSGRGVTLVLDARGEVVRSEGDSTLPFLLGQLHELPLVPLPGEPKVEWSTRTETQVTIVSSLLPRPPRSRGLPAPPGTEDRLNAVETTTYALAGDALTRTYRLATREEAGGKPRVEFTAEGPVEFAGDGFLPRRVAWKGEFAVREGGDSSVRTVNFTAVRLSPEEAADLAAKAEAERAATVADLKANFGPLAADLASGDAAKARAAATKLQQAEPGEGDAAIAEALKAAAEKSDKATRWLYAQGAIKWAAAGQTDLLASLLSEENISVRHAAMARLTGFRTAEAVEPVAAKLEDATDRYKAAELLKTFGPGAEPAVRKRLEHADWKTRSEAAGVLKEVGTPASLPALKKLAGDENALVKRRGQEAVAAIEARGK